MEADETRQRVLRVGLTGTMLKRIWRVWACPKRIHSLGINGEGRQGGKSADPGSPGIMGIKTVSAYIMHACVCARSVKCSLMTQIGSQPIKTSIVPH